jgi:hypothetical protein
MRVNASSKSATCKRDRVVLGIATETLGREFRVAAVVIAPRRGLFTVVNATGKWNVTTDSASTARDVVRIGERDRQDDRMIHYFISRGGRNLSATRGAELERAKRTLQRRAAAPKRAARKKR